MPEKIRDTAEFAFIQTVASGTVHIEVRYASYDNPFEEARGGQPPEKVPFAEGIRAMVSGPHIVLCGAKTYPTAERTHHYTGCFADEKLCQQCHRRLHPDDIERVFRHAQPDDLKREGPMTAESERTFEINEFLKEQVADRLQAALDGQERTRKVAIKILNVGSGPYGLTGDQEVPDLGSYVTWLTLRQLYRKTQDGAYDPAPTDFQRSIDQMRASVTRELVFIAKHNITAMPQDPYAEAELRARMRGYGEFIGDTDQMLLQVQERFPTETTGADGIKVGGS